MSVGNGFNKFLSHVGFSETPFKSLRRDKTKTDAAYFTDQDPRMELIDCLLINRGCDPLYRKPRK